MSPLQQSHAIGLLSAQRLDRSAARRLFRHETVRRVLDDHFARRASYDDHIWGFVTFMTWYRDYIASADGVPSTGQALAGSARSVRTEWMPLLNATP